MATLQKIARELHEIVTAFIPRLAEIDELEFSKKPLPGKWSKKEVTGHLIDSAQNNLRRFITGQYEPQPPHIVYDQDFWVEANDYNAMVKEDIIQLWRIMNQRIITVLERMPEAHYQRQCNTGKSAPSLHTLEWIAKDYIPHLKHHLNQILPNAYPGHVYP